MGGGAGRPNPHAYDPQPQVGVRGVSADPNSPAGGAGRGPSRDARPRDSDSWWSLGHWTHRAEEIVGSVIHKGEQFVHDAEDEIHRVREIYEAVMLSISYVPATVRAQIGVDVQELMRAFIPGLLMMFVILAATTLLGATIGAAIGALAGGVGALPGAIVGGDIGLDAGFAVLDAMGIAFLLAGMASELPKIFERIRGGVNAAWNAGHDPKVPASKDIEQAAHLFAEAIAEFMELLVQGLLAYLLRDGLAGKVGKISSKLDKLDATEAVAVRSRELVQALKNSPTEVRAAMKARLAQLANDLRKAGRWVEGLVEWFEKHLDNLIENFEKRHPRPEVIGSGGDLAGLRGAGAARRAQTYSDLDAYQTRNEGLRDQARQAGENRRAGGYQAKVTEAVGERGATQYMQNNEPDFVMDRGFQPGTGFDQVYTKYDAAGNPTEYRIVEAKGPGAELSTNAAKGPQMSQQWTENTITEMSRSNDPDTRALAQRLQTAIDDGDPPVTGQVLQTNSSGTTSVIPSPTGPTYTYN